MRDWYTTSRRSPALEAARRDAFGADYAAQESFITRSEVERLAALADVGRGMAVLDLCCGSGGPGSALLAKFGCSVTSVDITHSAARGAASKTNNAVVADVTRLPLSGPFEVAFLLETFLEFEDGNIVLDEVARVLSKGGRFVFTFQEGEPLTERERERLPQDGSVTLTSEPEMFDAVEDSGFDLSAILDLSTSHAESAHALLDQYKHREPLIADQAGRQFFDALTSSHEAWAEWLSSGRVRTLAVVAERE